MVSAICLLASGRAQAQAVDLRVPDPAADALAELRLDFQDERRLEGAVLLAGGLASVIGGAVAAGVGHEDPFWLAFGVGTAGWGAVNAGLSFGLLDVGDGARGAIEADRALRYEELDARRLDVVRAQHRSATLFALNLGLDVLYVASAVLMYALAAQLDAPEDAEGLRGYALAQASQGGFLFLFDLAGWLQAEARADRAAR